MKAQTGNEPSQISWSAEELATFQKDPDDIKSVIIEPRRACRTKSRGICWVRN
jgi:hypothetical protein